jgi:hypothetical protein
VDVNCCDEFGDCRQGRDCPIRRCPHCHGIGYDASGYACTCTTTASVAKVGRRTHGTHGKRALPPSPWRTYLRHLAKWMLIVICILFYVALLAGVAHA